MTMSEWLNYHHLLYFWTIAREGGLAPASRKLRLAPPTLSGQVKKLEAELGERLFERSGRSLVLTEIGRMVFDYSEAIFGLGAEMREALRGQNSVRQRRLVIGIADAVPKLVVRDILRPAHQHDPGLRLICREGKADALMGDLAAHRLDAVIADDPWPTNASVRAFNHLLGESSVTVFGVRALAKAHRAGFPESLHKAPMLLPGEATAIRRSLDPWLRQRGIEPQVVGEFDDSALLKAFGEDGAGLFASPTVIAKQICSQYGVEVVGHIDAVKERFYLLSIERRLTHPGTLRLMQTARSQLFS